MHRIASKRTVSVTFKEATSRDDYVDGTTATACARVGARKVCAKGSAYGHGAGPQDEALADALGRLAERLNRGT